MEYHGVMIGGPSDGKWVVSRYPQFLVAEINSLPIPAHYTPEDIPESIPVREHVYNWKPLPGRYQKEFGIFVHEGMDLYDAIEKMAENYRPLVQFTGGKY